MRVVFQNGLIYELTPISFDTWSKTTGRTDEESWNYYLLYNGFTDASKLDFNIPHNLEQSSPHYVTDLDYDKKERSEEYKNKIQVEPSYGTGQPIISNSDLIDFVNTEFRNNEKILGLSSIFISADLGAEETVRVETGGLCAAEACLLLSWALAQQTEIVRAQSRDMGFSVRDPDKE